MFRTLKSATAVFTALQLGGHCHPQHIISDHQVQTPSSLNVTDPVVHQLPNSTTPPNTPPPPLNQTTLANGTDVCDKPLRVSMPWTWLSQDEKQDYINAQLCLANAPPRMSGQVPFARNVWDELHYMHTWQANYVHLTGHFLAFHRYFTVAHATMMEEVCNYTGPLPYWNETADIGRMEQSPVFQPDAFGGNGANPGYSGDKYALAKDVYNNVSCITTGPFANVSLHITRELNFTTNYCISRVFNNTALNIYANQSAIDMCQNKQTYEEHWTCMAAYQHQAGHLGIGGVMGAVAINPGDFMFFLHHNWLDALWWQWQSKDLEHRLTDMSGVDVPPVEVRKSNNWGPPDEEVLYSDHDYPGNTTLDHNIYLGLVRNVTIREIMDVRGNAMCREYLYGEWLPTD